MKLKNKLLFSIFITIILLSHTAFADLAEDITSSCSISGNIDAVKITDGSIATSSGGENVYFEIKSDTAFSGIYIKFASIPAQGLLDGKNKVCEHGFLHDYISFSPCNEISLSFSDAKICDISVYTSGELPKEVQVWQKGQSDTDLLLCATHSDDDQLFFAGLLPLYTSKEDVNVRVAYFINHFDTYNRTHELLDGLWHCGVKNYPDISPFPDGYSESLDDAKAFLAAKGFDYDDILDFQQNLITKYKPKVVVLHDFEGEYGHGAHILNSKSFTEALNSLDENSYKPEKVYVHLYPQNKITLDIDTPLEKLCGLSPFSISQQAFEFHKSQHWTWFYSWIYGKNNTITKASQIKSYNPAYYGLYYTRVGGDASGTDMLENVKTYAQINAEILFEEQEKANRKNEQHNDLQQNTEENSGKSSHETEKAKKETKPLYKIAFALLVVLIIVIPTLLTYIMIKKSRNRN